MNADGIVEKCARAARELSGAAKPFGLSLSVVTDDVGKVHEVAKAWGVEPDEHIAAGPMRIVVARHEDAGVYVTVQASERVAVAEAAR